MSRTEVMKQLGEKKWSKNEEKKQTAVSKKLPTPDSEIKAKNIIEKKVKPFALVTDKKEPEEPKIDRRKFNGGTKKLQGEYKSTSVQTTEEERLIAMQAYGGIVKAFRWAIEQAKKKRGN